MPFERFGPGAKRIAVIGGGISGLGAAYSLAERHSVTLFEADERLGGHARTVWAGQTGEQPVDIGFIVFNYANYPNLVRLFEDLDVPVARSDMSFGASLRGGRLEYSLRTIDALFAQRRNLLDPRFMAMVRDILRFNARAEVTASAAPGQTIADLLDRLGTGAWFRDHYLLPLSGAIWSVPAARILDFPAATMIEFFRNHALLQHTGQHQWYTVEGGSVQYVDRLAKALEHRGVDIRTSAPIRAVRRIADGATVRPEAGVEEAFDEVVLATHTDDALRLLADADPVERRLLSAIRYQPNAITLHCDTAVMPRRRKCWSSWNYTESATDRLQPIDLTYWMNSLQPIPKSDPLFVTLNGGRHVRDDLIYEQTTFHHPVYDSAAIAAQGEISALNGRKRTWFCGAWMHNGFHEDGLASGLEVARRLSAGSDEAAEVA